MYYIFDLKKAYNIVYHIYLPLEYSIFSYFFYLNLEQKFIKKIILLAIILVVLFCCILSLNFVPVTSYPGDIFNLVGGGLTLWAIIVLFNLQPVNNVAFFKLPLFWICFGIIFFYPGMFFFNEVYEHLNNNQPELARKLNYYINKSLNCLLYTCFSISFICSNQMKKYT